MPENTVCNISFGKYFSLLRDTAPAPVDLFVCDTSGVLITAADDNADSAREGNSIIDVNMLSRLRCRPGETIHVPGDKECYLMPVCNNLEEPAAYLVASLADSNESLDISLDDFINRSFPAVISCMEKEYHLTAELDAMASELAGRYEELNLVYETSDEITDFGNEGRTLTRLIEKYIEHLDVDMVALAFPKQERIFSAANRCEPIPEAYEIINNISRIYVAQADNHGKFLLINDFIDPQRDEYHLTAPCKIMACPVLNNRGTASGVLICINNIQRPDFYNSDKNLLYVMAKKVAKIVQSHYDVLTGLINQQAFENVINNTINRSRDNGQFHCVLNIDLDKLKVINETLGRNAGDHIIRCVADLLQDKLRNADTLSYLGEGRYGAVLDQCTMEQGMQISETLREHVNDSSVTWENKPVDISITIGVALIEPHNQKIDDVLEAVEMARDAAKELGHKRIQVFRHDDGDLAQRKVNLHWVTRIQKALRNDGFVLYCQNICPTEPGTENYHFEVLLRLMDTDGALIQPGIFIPPAEQFNLMPLIDRWVIERTMATLSDAGISNVPGEGTAAINISGQSLTDTEFTNHVAKSIDRYNIAPECICFEITETTAIHDIRTAQEIFRQLRSMGFKLSLDDFGTGLSSFSYLKDIPVDYLKIDGSFVRSVIKDNVSLAMVASINHVGHVMGLKTIAEYVESDELAVQLKHIGVDFLQGYSIAKPVDLQDFLSGLRPSTSSCTG
jgi:diguanylate cyclase (GGDEF)-like protein